MDDEIERDPDDDEIYSNFGVGKTLAMAWAFALMAEIDDQETFCPFEPRRRGTACH